MAKVRLVAVNTLREIRSKKVVYIALFLAMIVGYSMMSSVMFTRSLMEADEAELAGKVKRQSVVWLLSTWKFFAVALALFLGATAISTEVKSKTLAAVLARPIERWQFLLGKWLGILLFLSGFLFIGIATAVGIGWYWGMDFPRTFWIGVAEQFILILFYSGVGLGLSAVIDPVAAGSTAFFLPILSEMTENVHHPYWQPFATAVYYLSPANMPGDLIGESLFKDLLTPNYPLYTKVLAAKSLYTLTVFILGCLVFSRRDAPLK